jgi:hypothetical protein
MAATVGEESKTNVLTAVCQYYIPEMGGSKSIYNGAKKPDCF